MKTLINTINGIDIYFTPLDEHIPMNEHLPEETPKEIERLYNNNEYFTAKVTAEIEGIEIANDYLGCCIYESYEKFYTTKDCYFSEMQNTVLTEAKKNIPNIIKRLQAAT